MANKQKQFDIQFKKDAVKFCEEHPDMTHDNDNLKITNYDHLKFTKNGKF